MAGGFPLDARVELDLNGWTDVTPYVLARDPISIKRGRSADASSTDPAECRFTLDNRDDRFSMRNPLGPYYGLLRRNVLCRVSLPADTPGLLLREENPLKLLGNQVTSPDASAWTVGNTLDIRVDMDADHWERGYLVSKYATSGNNREWSFYVLSRGRLALLWSPDGTLASRLGAFSAESLPDYKLPGRRAVRVVLTCTNGDGVYDVKFYTAETMAGPWTQIGSTTTGSAATSVFNGTSSVAIGNTQGLTGDTLPGRLASVEVRVDGVLVASPDFSAQSPDTTAFTDAQGRTWTLGSDAEISDRDFRFFGEVSQWPQSRDVSERDKTVTVTAYGLRRRLGYNAPVRDSAVRREFTSPKRTGVIAYWPMEDEKGATSISSAIPGHPPMKITGGVGLAEYPDLPPSRPLPYGRTGQMTGTIPPYDSSSGVVSVRVFWDVDANPATDQRMFVLRTTNMTWSVEIRTDGYVRVRALSDVEDTVYHTSDWTWTSDAKGLNSYGFISMNLEVRQEGSNVAYHLFVTDFQSDQVVDQAVPHILTIVGTVSGRTLGRATQIVVGPDRGLGEIAVGHLAVGNQADMFLDVINAMNAWNGETAETRLPRLSREDGITVRMVAPGLPDDYKNAYRLGDQTADSWLDLVEEVEFSDLGLLVESRDELAFRYRTRFSLFGQEPKVSLDYDAGEIYGDLRPVDDDSALINDVTVTRTDGGQYRAQVTEGHLSVLAPPFGAGTYATQVEVTAVGEEWLPDQASFRLRVGTVDQVRYPTLMVALHSPRVSEAQASRVRRLDIGDRVDILNADAWTPRVAQIVTGYVEELAVTSHMFEFNLTPADPWIVGLVDDDARCDTAGSELAADVGDGAPIEPDPLGTVLFRWRGDGLADGTSVTGGTAGSGDTPLDLATSGAAMVQGGRIQVDQQSGQAAQFAWQSGTLGTTRSRFGARATYELSGYTSGGNGRLISAYTASSGLLWFTTVMPSGILRIHNPSSTAVATSTNALPLDTPFRLDVTHLDGVVSIDVVVDGDVVETLSGDVGTGSTAVYEVRFGMPNVAPTWPRFWIDDMQFTDPDVVPPTDGETLLVSTSSGPPWTTDPADVPFDVMVGGELMTVTAVSGSSQPQTFTVTRSVNGVVRQHAAGTAVALARPAYTAY